MGAWTLIGALLAMLAGAVYVAYEGWTSVGDVAVPTSVYVAMGIGIFFSILVGSGLMVLLFYSNRSGHDARISGEAVPDERGDHDPGERPRPPS